MTLLVFAGPMLSTQLAGAPRRKAPRAMLVRELVPQDRISLGASDKELSSRHKYFERYQTLYADLEFQILDFWSIYGVLPYSKRYQTDSETTRRLDNIRMGSRLGFRAGKRLLVGTGLDIELATGDEKVAAIGSKELGSLEPWLGFLYHRHGWMMQAGLRYNAQTNKQFREKENQQFERTLFVDGLLGYRFSAVDLVLEYNYKYRRDPEEKAISTHTLGPSLHLRLGDDDSMLLSIGVPWALSREREWDHTIRMEFSYFY